MFCLHLGRNVNKILRGFKNSLSILRNHAQDFHRTLVCFSMLNCANASEWPNLIKLKNLDKYWLIA